MLNDALSASSSSTPFKHKMVTIAFMYVVCAKKEMGREEGRKDENESGEGKPREEKMEQRNSIIRFLYN